MIADVSGVSNVPERKPYLAKPQDLASASFKPALILSLDLRNGSCSFGNIFGNGHDSGTLA
jgi:hypothetical protein